MERMEPEGTPFMSTVEVMRELGVSRQTVHTWIRRGVLATVAGHDGRNLFAKNQVAALAEDRASQKNLREAKRAQRTARLTRQEVARLNRIAKLKAELARLEAGTALTA
jgi:predicted site-specific integrase-resolvase